MDNNELFKEILEEIDAEKTERNKPTEPLLRVAHNTPPKRLMKTIIGCLKDWGKCRIHAVGPVPTWQAYKACVLAKAELATIGINIYIDPSFMDPRPIVDDMEKTGADFSIKMSKESL